MPTSPRILPAVIALTLSAPAAWALEGAPPFEVVPAGRSVPELNGEVFLFPDAGMGGGYLHGPGERSMRAKSYFMAPFGVRYGLWKTLEAWGAVPLVWGSSPQQYVDARTEGTPTYRATLSGFDGSDAVVGLRLEPWSSDDEELAAVLTVGLVAPLGTNVWQNSRYGFVNGPVVPDFASGDGAWKILTAVEGIRDTEETRVSVLVGYLRKLEQEATAIEPPASTIKVTLPSPVVGWVRPAWKMTEDTWLTARVDGFWAHRGSIATSGAYSSTPEALPALLDSYGSLIDGSWGIWAGIGMREALSDTAAASLEVCLPVLERNLYRLWRLVGAVTWSWKP